MSAQQSDVNLSDKFDTMEPNIGLNPDTTNGFLHDIHPAQRRVILAIHQHYVQETKLKEIDKQVLTEDKYEKELSDLLMFKNADGTFSGAGDEDTISGTGTRTKKRKLIESFSDEDYKSVFDDDESIYTISSLPSCSSSLTFLDCPEISTTDTVISNKKNRTAHSSIHGSTVNPLVVNHCTNSSISDDTTDSSSSSDSDKIKSESSSVSVEIESSCHLQVMTHDTGHINLYHKFLTYFQHFYNQHDALGLTSFLFFPSCSKVLEKAMIVWKSCFILPPMKYKNSVTFSPSSGVPTGQPSMRIIPNLGNKPASLNVKFPYSLPIHTIESTYNRSFTRLPDSLIAYHNELIKIKQHAISKDIYVYAPYSFFATIPAVTIRRSADHDPEIIHNISVEARMCAVLIFSNEYRQLKAMEENCYRLLFDNALVHAKDVMGYFDFQPK